MLQQELSRTNVNRLYTFNERKQITTESKQFIAHVYSHRFENSSKEMQKNWGRNNKTIKQIISNSSKGMQKNERRKNNTIKQKI